MCCVRGSHRPGSNRNLSSSACEGKFFSTQADGSTDSGNVDALYLVVYFDPCSKDGEVHVRNEFLIVRRSAHCNAEVYECIVRALD